MSTHKSAQANLKKAKARVRKWRSRGVLPEAPPLPFGYTEKEERKLEQIIERSEEPRPYAEYLAPYRLALNKQLHPHER